MAASFQNSPQDILGGNDFKQPNLSMVQGKNACVSTHLFGVGFDYGGGGPNISSKEPGRCWVHPISNQSSIGDASIKEAVYWLDSWAAKDNIAWRLVVTRMLQSCSF